MDGGNYAGILTCVSIFVLRILKKILNKKILKQPVVAFDCCKAMLFARVTFVWVAIVCQPSEPNL